MHKREDLEVPRKRAPANPRLRPEKAEKTGKEKTKNSEKALTLMSRLSASKNALILLLGTCARRWRTNCGTMLTYKRCIVSPVKPHS